MLLGISGTLTGLFDNKTVTEMISSMVSFDCFNCISMVLEVNKCIVSLHYNASDATTIVENLLKILLLSTARNASNIHLGKFGITLWWRRPSAYSAAASRTVASAGRRARWATSRW